MLTSHANFYKDLFLCTGRIFFVLCHFYTVHYSAVQRFLRCSEESVNADSRSSCCESGSSINMFAVPLQILVSWVYRRCLCFCSAFALLALQMKLIWLESVLQTATCKGYAKKWVALWKCPCSFVGPVSNVYCLKLISNWESLQRKNVP